MFTIIGGMAVESVATEAKLLRFKTDPILILTEDYGNAALS